MFARRRPRSRNATVGYSDLKCVVHKLAVKFSDFPNFKVALETQYKQWQPKKQYKQSTGRSEAKGTGGPFATWSCSTVRHG